MGLATARAFAEAGAAVVMADINQTTLGMATDELTAAGHQVLGVPCDVSEENSVAAMVKAARSHGGDIIVHRACPRRGSDRAHLASWLARRPAPSFEPSHALITPAVMAPPWHHHAQTDTEKGQDE
jgi:NAD(P)-dependent dehydrogenase (short-subunit alcohol dehydrogenase family)